MDGKRKHFVASGGFKKKRKRFVDELAVLQLQTSIESNSSSIICSTSEENAEIASSEFLHRDTTEIIKSGLIDDENNPDVNQIQVINSVDSETEKVPFNINHFQFNLASWAVSNKVNHEQLRGLLKIWNECVPLPKLPADPRTVLATPRTIHLENENYWHYGLKKSLDKIFQRIAIVPEKVSLKINFDGIPMSKSSNIECWPILCEVKELPKLPPFIVGVYCGTSMI